MGYNRDLKRFESKFKKTDGCWNWLAAKKGGGYGTFYFNKKLHGAHRVALLFYKNEPLETPLHAIHSCDNPSCVNPDHIKYGTRSENMRDCSKKGRLVIVTDWRGKLNPKAKLDERDYKKIINLFNNGMTRKQIASIFSVSSVRVGQIILKG